MTPNIMDCYLPQFSTTNTPLFKDITISQSPHPLVNTVTTHLSVLTSPHRAQEYPVTIPLPSFILPTTRSPNYKMSSKPRFSSFVGAPSRSSVRWYSTKLRHLKLLEIYTRFHYPVKLVPASEEYIALARSGAYWEQYFKPFEWHVTDTGAWETSSNTTVVTRWILPRIRARKH